MPEFIENEAKEFFLQSEEVVTLKGKAREIFISLGVNESADHKTMKRGCGNWAWDLKKKI